MGNKTSSVIKDKEGTRGSRGCFGWVTKAFKKKKRGRRHKEEPHEPLADEELDSDAHSDNEENGTNQQKDEETKGNVAETEENNKKSEVKDAETEENNEMNEVKVAGKEEDDEKNECDIEEDGRGEACSAAAALDDVGEERQNDQASEELVATEQEPRVVMTWAEEVDDAEEKGMDVFAPLTTCLPHAAFFPGVVSDSTESESTAAVSTKMSAGQRRRARRRALAAARNTSTQSETEAPATMTSEARPACAEAISEEPAVLDTTPAESSEEATVLDTTTTVIHSETNATRRRRARRRALAAARNTSTQSETEAPATMNREARPPFTVLDTTPVESCEKPPAPDTTPADSSEEATVPDTTTTAIHSETNATKRRRARRKAVAARMKSEARLATTDEDR